jgi:SAM-dependent methyltransferase
MENHTNPTYNKRMHQTTDAKLEPLEPYLKPGVTLLDFGSGFNPDFITSIEETGATYYGYDISPIVNQQFKENKIKHLIKEDLDAQNETFDVIYLSSVLHEFFSYLSPKDYRDTMATIVKALKPDGYLILRDWPIIQETDTYQKYIAKDENAAKIIDYWRDALKENAVTGPIQKSNPTTYHANNADLFELIFHVSWGLESLERESQERYHMTESQIIQNLLYPFDLTLIHAYHQDDETYLPHLQKYFNLNSMPSPTKTIHIIQKRKDPRLNMITITQPKAKTLVNKTIELAIIDLTDDQKETLSNQLAILPFNVSAESQDEKLEEIATLIETIEDYVEKEGITIDNAERMEAVMYEGIPAEETSAFYGSRYYAIEDMMLQELY